MGSSAHQHRRLLEIAEPYGGALSRDLLRLEGADHAVVARQVDAARWQLMGRQTVALHNGRLSVRAQWWRAIWEVSASDVALDGVSSLNKAGLTGFDTGDIDVSIPWQARVLDVPGVRIHRVGRNPGDVIGPGPPRVRSALATVRGAHWADSDRQAALVLVMPVQQRLVRPHQLLEASVTDRVRGRRQLVRQLVRDIADGSHSLGELDFARLCRRRGLPAPDRQAIVQTKTGRFYLDVRWTGIGLVVEIDGSGHVEGLAAMDDTFRQNAVTLGRHTVLRYGLLALRISPERVLDQVCEAHALLGSARSA